MARVRRQVCGKCSGRRAPDLFGIRVAESGLWVSSFSYAPREEDARRRAAARRVWEASEGVWFAPDVKALLGERPRAWRGDWAPAGAVADWMLARASVLAHVLPLCDACASPSGI